jgi:hyperosmotically inducible periplasmic protein
MRLEAQGGAYSHTGGVEMRAFLGALVALTLLAGSPFVADAGGRSMGEKVDDGWITTKVKAKLSTEQFKSLVNVNVDTKNGVVHLQGVVPTLADKADAERLALATEGVLSVRNDLKVATSTGSSPAASPSTR